MKEARYGGGACGPSIILPVAPWQRHPTYTNAGMSGWRAGEWAPNEITPPGTRPATVQSRARPNQGEGKG